MQHDRGILHKPPAVQVGNMANPGFDLSNQTENNPSYPLAAQSALSQAQNCHASERLLMARQEQDRLDSTVPMAPGVGDNSAHNHALQDYQLQLMLLEQQKKKRQWMARQEQDS